MTIRSEGDLEAHPCSHKLRDFEKQTSTSDTTTVKKIVPKLDENGNQIYKEVEIKKGCGCKNSTVKIEIKKIPETTEIYVEESISQNQQMVICKLFGLVSIQHCLNCRTYKAK